MLNLITKNSLFFQCQKLISWHVSDVLTDDSLPESKQKINRVLIVYKSWLRSRREWFETDKERLDFEEFNHNHISELNEKFKNSTKIEMYISDDEFWNEILDRKLNESS